MIGGLHGVKELSGERCQSGERLAHRYARAAYLLRGVTAGFLVIAKSFDLLQKTGDGADGVVGAARKAAAFVRLAMIRLMLLRVMASHWPGIQTSQNGSETAFYR